MEMNKGLEKASGGDKEFMYLVEEVVIRSCWKLFTPHVQATESGERLKHDGNQINMLMIPLLA